MTYQRGPERSADEVARLVEENQALIGWCLRKLPRGDVRRFHDELLSDGLKALHQSAVTWRPERGEFSTLVCSFLPKRLGGLLARLKRESCQVPVRLDQRTGEGQALHERIPGRDHAQVDEDAVRRVREALRHLPPRYREAVERRFGMGDNEPMTLEEIGAAMGITKERVRQLIQRSLARLSRCGELVEVAEFRSN